MKSKIHLSIVFLILFQNKSFTQDKYQFFISAGPNIGIINEYWNNEQIFFAFPPRPYYKVAYHYGFGVERKFSLVDLRSGLFFEKITSASYGFNGELDKSADIFFVPISGFIPPVKKYPVKLEFGLSGYLLWRQGLFTGLSTSRKTVSLSSILGIEYNFYKDFSLGVRWLETLTPHKERIEVGGNFLMIDSEKKIQSFQFAITYKI